jgi:putative endonuclease
VYYVYVLKSITAEKLYFGYTKDLKKRLAEHNAGETTSTKGFQWKLVYYEAYTSKSDAMRRERKLKSHGQAMRWLKERIKESLEL